MPESEPRICALDGCDVSLDGKPATAKYCSKGHMHAASKRRLRSAAREARLAAVETPAFEPTPERVEHGPAWQPHPVYDRAENPSMTLDELGEDLVARRRAARIAAREAKRRERQLRREVRAARTASAW